MIAPDYEEFLRRAERGNLIPVYKEILADLETPVSAYCKVKRGSRAFLLESVEGGETLGRFSFIGTEPRWVLVTSGKEATLLEDGRATPLALGAGLDPLELIRAAMARYKPVGDRDLPPFYGGFVGYIGHDVVGFFEDLDLRNPDDMGVPDCVFVLADSLVVFDQVKHTILLVANAFVEGDPKSAYERAVARIEELETRLRAPFEPPPFGAGRTRPLAVTLNRTKEDYCAAVEKALEYIRAGDAFQIVLSLRRQTEVNSTALDLYRALRRLNPSPYMFLLENEECTLIGSSPETLVKLVGDKVQYRPIAGTRPRGATPEEDSRLEEELLADPKERAEHIMLVDLGRNDVGRVCVFNSVRVTDLMVVERYSHVMHIVSKVVGTLSPGKTPFDLLRAVFPAGTLSGAPKIRAMEIIEELEPTKRGPYGGCVGYLGFGGNLDTCITIRTIVMKGRMAYIQAGGGLVYDSLPENEFQEALNKSRAMLRAVEIAERGEF
ncbi:MAG: Anthranilate synthase component 1 [bacterium]|nr:Anthranilate synthase component 1 [bacterium]